MNGILLSIAAFIVAIGVLVTVHEFGHFWVARKMGVKVLRFSVGFGRPLWQKTIGVDKTELVIAAVPLGGYVKMLDEREGEVATNELDRAFNRKSLGARFAIVLAGPVFNFLFAIMAYWVMFVSGVPGVRPVIGEVVPSSYAAQAGFVAGDEILAVNGKPTPSWETAILGLLDAGLDEQAAFTVTVRNRSGNEAGLKVRLDESARLLGKGGLLDNFGIKPWRPSWPAVIDRLVAGSPGERAGLQAGDRVVSANELSIDSWSQWVDYVRSRPGERIPVTIERDSALLDLVIVPEAVRDDGETVGRIGAYVRLSDAEQHDTMRVVVRHGLVAAAPAAVGKTWEMSTLTLRTLWKMVTGKVSIENLSGPISIAQYAGHSAAIGLTSFLGFLAIVSISLGVLNLLPVPILDGGHLLYYVIEFFKGSPVSETAQLIGQRIGIFLLLALMSLAFYNDLARLFG
ncbi:MAG: RIP metalloprotease RseP [Thiohalobacterales bacterium]